MIHILLVILKIIGILIAAILGIFVLLLCIVLFHAVRYQAKASSERQVESLRARFRISWLLGLIRFEAKVEGTKVDWKIRLFWKKIQNEEGTWQTVDEAAEQTENVANEVEKGLSEGLSEKEVYKEEPTQEQETSEKELFQGQEPKAESDTDGEDGESRRRAREENETRFRKNRTSSKKSEKKKQPSLWEQLLAWKEKIAYTFQGICDKIKILEQKKEMLIKFLSYDIHKHAWEKVKKELFWLLKKLKPDKIKSNILFGFEDPYHTGLVLAFLSMIYPFMGEEVKITPDFERRILQGSLEVKGKIRFCLLAKIAWKLFWCKDVRVTFKHIRHIGKKLVGGKEYGREQQ